MALLVIIQFLVETLHKLQRLEELDIVVATKHLVRDVIVAAGIKADERALLPVLFKVMLVHPFAGEVLLQPAHSIVCDAPYWLVFSNVSAQSEH